MKDSLDPIFICDYFRKRRAYLVSPKSLNYVSIDLDRTSSRTFRGYGIVHRQELFGSKRALYALAAVEDGRIIFLADTDCFDVTNSSWHVSLKKRGCFAYEFLLLEDSCLRLKIRYWEFTDTRGPDPDPHFFVDVAHWLSGPAARRHLLSYWGANE